MKLAFAFLVFFNCLRVLILMARRGLGRKGHAAFYKSEPLNL